MDKPKVFVAMAFGPEDTERLYTEVLEATINSNGCIPVRIDRTKEPGFINEKIIRKMDEADIGLVDLTYERPSVYYEAGYMQARGIPVIYCVRADHLDRKIIECRVHFDVEQREIEPWAHPQDSVFKRELEDRLRIYLKSFLKKSNKLTTIQKEIGEFEPRAQIYKEALLLNNLLKVIKDIGIKRADVSKEQQERLLKDNGLPFFETSNKSIYRFHTVQSGGLFKKLKSIEKSGVEVKGQYNYLADIVLSFDDLSAERCRKALKTMHYVSDKLFITAFEREIPRRSHDGGPDAIVISNQIRSERMIGEEVRRSIQQFGDFVNQTLRIADE